MTSLMSSKEGGGDGPVVELTVKSANQSFDDLIVQCENVWSVKQLKEQITEKYPFKLQIEDQKLIYSGKLLTDDLILKDILRCFDDPEINKQQKHIFHLVYSSKTRQPVPTPNKSTTSPNTTTEPATTIAASVGLRQRNVQQTTDPLVTASSSNAANMFNFPGGPAGPQYFMAQQMAMHNWMQQVYWQYMNQYMNSTNTSENRPQGPQFIPQNFIPQMPAMPYFPAANFQPQPASQAPQPEPQPQVPAPAQPQPRFPNIVQEEQENRDWLDIFYLGCRLMLFIMLIYFYSSATRCMLVIGGAIGIYLYHNGYFRNQNPTETNNNNVNNNNRNVDDIRIQEVEPQEAPAVEEVAPAPEAAEAQPTAVRRSPEAAVPAAQNPGTSVMSIIKTFVVTFITSLLPDTQTL
ncbi:HERPUD1 family protein [Megaselia abdita]